MKQLKIAILTALCATITLSTLAGTTVAITGNSQADQTPYTCIIVLYSDADRTQPLSYSTGVLISPTVVLTAGHCVAGGESASVCFGQNPTATTDQTIYNGTPIAYPPFIASILAEAKPNEALRTSDVGLIILDTPVQDITTYPSLPTADLAATLKTGTNLQVVGYGVQEQITPRNTNNTWIGTLQRNTATVELLSNHFQGSTNYIKCTANAAQNKGGIAYGDSGGPVIYNMNGQSIVLAVNAYVNNGNCAGVTFHTRIDNPLVLNWINGYL